MDRQQKMSTPTFTIISRNVSEIKSGQRDKAAASTGHPYY